ncbi:MAG: hypothetical protein JSU86_04860 [Phycisphaerales bacterium]|nr:MAG: hypothetical protein JSU86_04860 [Phycisphaerales bacterium]
MKEVKLIGVAILILVGVAVGILCWPSNKPFTREKWINATPQMRDRLLESLARSGILIGLTEKEVYEKLGDPDGSSHGRAMYYFRDEGRSRPCLMFRFSRDGHVESRGLWSMGGTTSDAEFDAETWRHGTPADRLSMVRDLIASHPLEGMHRDDLYGLLGNPDRETPTGPKVWYCRRYYGENGEIKRRYAGISKCLYIWFSNGTVEEVRFTGS